MSESRASLRLCDSLVALQACVASLASTYIYIWRGAAAAGWHARREKTGRSHTQTHKKNNTTNDADNNKNNTQHRGGGAGMWLLLGPCVAL